MQAKQPRPAARGPEASLCLERRADGVQVAGFRAMASPCEILAQDVDPARLARVAGEVVAEVRRIERKFTRFGAAGVPAQLRRCAGRSARVDAETAMLIDIAARWYERSGGLFDITCGALQRLWRFGVATRPPTPDAVARVLPQVGFHRLRWTPPMLSMPPGMEIDLGGIGKEYAVDRAHDLLAAQLDAPALVNLGGDNTVVSDIGLVNTYPGASTGTYPTQGAGIGVEDVDVAALGSSTLTVTGDLSDGIIQDSRSQSIIYRYTPAYGTLTNPEQSRLIEEVWGPDHVSDTRSLRGCIRNLRAKLEPDPHRPRYLLTEAGLGYRLHVDNVAEA